MKVPFVDLVTQYQSLKSEIDSTLIDVCSTASFILGPHVERFEKNFASFLGSRFAVGVGNGTESLTLSYQALGIGPGDEVILPAHTFVATAIGVMNAGARPVLADVDPTSYLIEIQQIEELITPRTKAICPVHLYGRACNMDAIMEIAKRHNLYVVEDAAQSHGAKWNGKTTGTFGAFGSFSFFPGKNLGAYGDGGAVVTDSEQLNQQIRKLRNYGSEVKYHHPERGTNCRLDGIQAAVLDIKLKHLKDWNMRRWQAAKGYCEQLTALEQFGVVLPELCSPEEHVFHLFVIRVPNREQVMKRLAEKEIQTGIHYPIPFHLQGGYDELGYRAGDFPVTEELAQEILSLPVFPEISGEQISFVCEGLKRALQ